MLLLSARLVLAFVFGVAAWAKLIDAAGTRKSMVDFGVPRALAPLIALLVPVLEAACVVALLRASWAWWGAIGALALLGTFMLAVAANMALGRQPDCHCFGQLHVSRTGWPTLYRNGVFAAVAAVLVWRGPAGVGPDLLPAALEAGRWVATLHPALLVWAVIAGLAGIWLYRSLPEGPPKHDWLEAAAAAPKIKAAAPAPPLRAVVPSPAIGELEEHTPAPSFALESLHGLTVTLDDLRRAGQPIVLIFTRPTCPACDTLLPDIGRWQREHADRLIVMPVSKGGVEANREKADAHGLVDVLLQQQDEVSAAYGVQILPSGVLIRDGRIAQRYAEGPEGIRMMVANATSPPL
jgi:peroxiredoxin